MIVLGGGQYKGGLWRLVVMMISSKNFYIVCLRPHMDLQTTTLYMPHHFSSTCFLLLLKITFNFLIFLLEFRTFIYIYINDNAE